MTSAPPLVSGWRARSLSACLTLSIVLSSACSEPRWEPVFTELSSGLVGVWGRSSTEVYAVGSDSGDGPMVLAFDGSGWTRLATGQSGDLWWVHGVPDGPVFLGGAGGMILRYVDGAFERMETPGTGTVFGIWGTGPSDVWAVGGVGASAGFAWHYDGAAWTEQTVPELDGRAVFKVWGTSTDDVWMVGAGGAMAHWDGAAISPVDAGTTRTLFTVHAIEGRTTAVGGAGSATIVERSGDAAAFSDVTPPELSALIGVWLTPGGGGWAVGANGVIAERQDGAWTDVTPLDLPFVQAFHGVWVDETGGVWAVGGQVISSPLSDGVLMHRGDTVPGGTFVEGP